MRGVCTGRTGVGYELLTRYYGCFLVPSRPGAAFTRRVEAGPLAMMRLMRKAAVGVSRNMKSQSMKVIGSWNTTRTLPGGPRPSTG